MFKGSRSMKNTATSFFIDLEFSNLNATHSIETSGTC
jgi:hypothetical protein